MDVFRIQGGEPLMGEVRVGGSKNAALPLLVASLLVEEGVSTLQNVPDLRDIRTALRVLEHLGVATTFDPDRGTVTLDATDLVSYEAPYDLVKQMRASFLVMGPLLGRMGKARVSLPGGCAIGPRPVDQHRRAFLQMGASLTDSEGYIEGEALPLKGATVYFDRPSHTGTENVMMGAVLAEGTTTILNAACDPEVADLAAALNAAGARISGAGSARIVVEGVAALSPLDHRVMPDRLEAGTFMAACAAAGGAVSIREARIDHLGMVAAKFREMGARVTEHGDGIDFEMSGRPEAVNAVTYPYPGFPTDLQAALIAVACVADGTSVIRETVFEDRFVHLSELARLGAEIRAVGDEATVVGTERLSGTTVMASDIRAGAGLVVACLAAEGESVVNRVYHVDRGYERLEERLTALGATIAREDDKG
ncbi:UDP-N-acetylglucosamine 1-carboxyvinyltransferase [Gemmatimonadota bacterium]